VGLQISLMVNNCQTSHSPAQPSDQFCVCDVITRRNSVLHNAASGKGVTPDNQQEKKCKAKLGYILYSFIAFCSHIHKSAQIRHIVGLFDFNAFSNLTTLSNKAHNWPLAIIQPKAWLGFNGIFSAEWGYIMPSKNCFVIELQYLVS